MAVFEVFAHKIDEEKYQSFKDLQSQKLNFRNQKTM